MSNIEAIPRLKASVQFKARADHIVVLDTASFMPALRLPLAALSSLQLLASAHAITHPLDQKTHRLAQSLAKYGFLHGGEALPEVFTRVVQGCVYLPNPDRLAAFLARQLQRVAPQVLKFLGIALLIVASAAVMQQLWSWSQALEMPALSLWGVLLYISICSPLHELAHAVACRYAGVAVSGMGIQYRGRFLPSPFINTNNLILVNSRKLRAMVCLAGPIFDMFCVALASLAITRQWPQSAIWHTLGVCAIFFGVFNLNPLRPSDGSNALREWHTDEHGRQMPVTTTQQRGVLIAYLLLFTIVMLCFIPHLVHHSVRIGTYFLN